MLEVIAAEVLPSDHVAVIADAGVRALRTCSAWRSSLSYSNATTSPALRRTFTTSRGAGLNHVNEGVEIAHGRSIGRSRHVRRARRAASAPIHFTLTRLTDRSTVGQRPAR